MSSISPTPDATKAPSWAVGTRDVHQGIDGGSSGFIVGPETEIRGLDESVTVRAEQFTGEGYADEPHVALDTGLRVTLLSPAQARALAVALTGAAGMIDPDGVAQLAEAGR